MTPEDALLTSGQVARRLGVDASTVRRWALSGQLHAAYVTPGGRRRYRASDVDALLATERRTA